MATQIKAPNLDPYITQNGVVLQDWLGWCLAYVQTAFGTGWAGATAWDSWTQKTQFKHADGNMPSGVYVPIWFSHTGTYGGVTKNWGHVAIYKDGVVWTSPYSHKPYADRLTIPEIERIYNAKFVGWSEDLAGSLIIRIGDVPMSPDEERNAYQIVLNRAMEHGGSGRTGYKFIVDAKAEVDAQRSANAKLVADLQALANKPPKEVKVEVEKIVTEYVDREVIKEVEVDKPFTDQDGLNWLKKKINQLFGRAIFK